MVGVAEHHTRTGSRTVTHVWGSSHGPCAVPRAEELRSEIRYLTNVLVLVEEYLPVCLVLGQRVRDAYWAGRQVGTGHQAKEVLLITMLVHLQLGARAPHKLEYFRAVACALMASSPWNDQVPACLYVEEACEAMLSRLSAACKLRPQVITVDEVSDLFCVLPVVQAAERVVSRHHPTVKLCRVVSQNLHNLMRSQPAVPQYTPWSSFARVCIALEEWPAVVWFPGTLWEVVPQDALRALVLYDTLLLLPSDVPEHSMVSMTCASP